MMTLARPPHWTLCSMGTGLCLSAPPLYLHVYKFGAQLICAEKARGLKSNFAAAAAKSPQSCLTLCDPIDSSPPGSPIPGILQAGTLEWVAIAFSI